jgi:hypothetical protein
MKELLKENKKMEVLRDYNKKLQDLRDHIKCGIRIARRLAFQIKSTIKSRPKRVAQPKTRKSKDPVIVSKRVEANLVTQLYQFLEFGRNLYGDCITQDKFRAALTILKLIRARIEEPVARAEGDVVAAEELKKSVEEDPSRFASEDFKGIVALMGSFVVAVEEVRKSREQVAAAPLAAVKTWEDHVFALRAFVKMLKNQPAEVRKAMESAWEFGWTNTDRLAAIRQRVESGPPLTDADSLIKLLRG